MTVALVAVLPYPLLLGRDTPVFWDLVQGARVPILQRTMLVTDYKSPQARTDSQDDGAQPGPSQEAPIDPFEEVSRWTSNPFFQTQRESDTTLKALQALVAVQEGQIMDSRQAGLLPHVIREGSVWFHLAPGKSETNRQALVLQAFRNQLLHMAHAHSWTKIREVRPPLSGSTCTSEEARP